MLILAQDNLSMFDTDKCLSVYVKENIVYVLNYSGELTYPLGKYESEDRAREVMEDIFLQEGCQGKYEMPVI